MKFQYLGTAAAEGIPALFCGCDICREAARRGGRELRMRSGALVNDNLLIDLSPDLYAAKLQFQLDLTGVRNAIITHAHSDHFDREMMGFFTPTCAHIAKTGDLFHLWGSAYTASAWKEYTSTMQMKEPALENYVVFHEIKPFETIEIEGVRVTALKARHSCPESLIYLLEQGDARLFYGNDTGKAIADYLAIYDEVIDDSQDMEIFDPDATWKRKNVYNFTAKELQVPIFSNGELVYQLPTLEEIRTYCAQQVDTLWDEVKRFDNPQTYYVDLSQKLWDIKYGLLKSNGK